MDTLSIDFNRLRSKYFSAGWESPASYSFWPQMPIFSFYKPYVSYLNYSSDLCGDIFSTLRSGDYDKPVNPKPQSGYFDSYDYMAFTNPFRFDTYNSLNSSNNSWFKLLELKLPEFKLPSFRKSLPAKSNIYRDYEFNTAVKYTSLKDAGYNSELAQKLAKEVASHVESGSTGFCSRYVSDAMARLGIAGARGDAWELKSSLRNNPHFKEIDPSSVDVAKLPAGCVLVYPRGDAGYSNDFGHVEITLGDGTAASDFINRNVKQSQNMSIFVPVSA